jgi:hypothetical protein
VAFITVTRFTTLLVEKTEKNSVASRGIELGKCDMYESGNVCGLVLQSFNTVLLQDSN